MLLPMQKLKELDYYHCDEFERFDSFYRRTVITLFWKKKGFFANKPQKLYFKCIDKGDKFTISSEAIELNNQLKEWVKTQNQEFIKNAEIEQQEKKVSILLDKCSPKKPNKKVFL